MKKLLPVLALILLLPSCGLFTEAHKIDAKEIQPLVNDILTRHDAYVMADPNLLLLEKETYLSSSKILRDTIEEAAVH